MTADHDPSVPPLTRSELWSLREDVIVELPPDDGSIRLRGRWGTLAVQRPSHVVREALSRMRLGPISLENVMSGRDAWATADAQRSELQRVLTQLQTLIIRSLRVESGQPLLSVVPMTAQSLFSPVPLAPDVPIRLSAYAALRTDRDAYCLESPLSLHRVVLHRVEAVTLLASLASPVTPAAVAASLPSLGQLAAYGLAYLAAAGMVVQADGADGAAPVFAEDTSPDLAGWSPTDLMFHSVSTIGRHDHDFGGTYPSGLAASPEAVVKPQAPQSIQLRQPGWEQLREADPSLTEAIEGRRSVRRHGARPISVNELGDLLYRTARVRSLVTVDQPGQRASGDPEAGYELSDRPYPSAGACCELEFYATAGNCEDLDPGVYHYDPLGHRLEPVSADPAAISDILGCAQLAAAMDAPPQVVISMTARFRRLSWKYEGLPYRLVLMHVGVLMQSLYLVCTAMRLAPCALGTVSVTAAARAFGTDWRVEPCVGQFVIGREPDAPDSDSRGRRHVNDAHWVDLARDALQATTSDRQEGSNLWQGVRQPVGRPAGRS